MDTWTVVNPYNGIKLSNKKKWTEQKGNMDKSQSNHAE